MDNLDVEIQKHKHIVLGFEHYNTLGVIRSLGEKGLFPVVILHKTGIKVEPCLVPNSRYISKIHIVEGVEEGYRILFDKYSKDDYKPFLYSCDDYVEMFLDSHFEELKNKFFFFDGGCAGIITKYMDKDAISQLAVECGCKVPKTEIVRRGVLPKTLKYPVITKAKISAIGGWKNDVRICQSAEELEEAYKTIKSENLLIEEFIDKKNELCLDGFCINHGNDICIPFQTTYLRVAPVYKKVVWGVVVATIAYILLSAGSLKPLQTISIAATLPFLIVMIAMMPALVKDLRNSCK